MSIRGRVAGLADLAAYARARLAGADAMGGVALLPVMHVEQLHVEENYRKTIAFCEQYRRLTGKMVVTTVIPPISPILRKDLERVGCSTAAYADKIRRIGECSIVGHHGHYLRPSGEGSTDRGDDIRPMHAAFFDASYIRAQMSRESEWLTSNGLMNSSEKIYSAGWWFMTPALYRILDDLGYSYDFSLSLSRDSYSHSAWMARKRWPGLRGPLPLSDGGGMLGAYAVSGFSTPRRPFAAVRRIMGEMSRRAGSTASQQTCLTFYSHDYDLAPDDAIRSIEQLQKVGCRFFEPRDLRAPRLPGAEALNAERRAGE